MKAAMKCLIIDDMHPSILPLLSSIGFEGSYRPDISKEELLEVVDQFEGIFVRSKLYFSKEVIEKAVKLKFIARAGAGMDNLDVAELEKRGIIVINAPEGNRDAVAEQTLGMLLSLLNNVLKADKEVRLGKWDREGNRGYELMGKTVGILGYGFMGKATAKRLASFGCTVIAYDKFKVNYTDAFAKEVSLDEFKKEVDVLSIHIPLTQESKFSINDSYISSFAKSIWLINTASGELIPLRDLETLLETGKLKGVALDVLENEKLATLTTEQKSAYDYLASSSRVILTPHIAGWTYESYEKINQVLVEKLKQELLNG